jgi:conjugal transfer/entry exclusion protein
MFACAKALRFSVAEKLSSALTSAPTLLPVQPRKEAVAAAAAAAPSDAAPAKRKKFLGIF